MCELYINTNNSARWAEQKKSGQANALMYDSLVTTKEQAVDKAKAIELAGGVTALAKILGICKSSVSEWTEIPQARIWQLKVIRPQWFRKPKATQKREADAV